MSQKDDAIEVPQPAAGLFFIGSARSFPQAGRSPHGRNVPVGGRRDRESKSHSSTWGTDIAAATTESAGAEPPDPCGCAPPGAHVDAMQVYATNVAMNSKVVTSVANRQPR